MPKPASFRCPNPACEKRLFAAVTAAGKSARCHGCGVTFKLERSTSADGSDSIVPADAELPLPPPPPPPPTAPAPALPATIGRYRVISSLGGGAFGRVYRAYDPDLEREVAVKVPQPGTLTTPTRVRRFLGDARAAARLRHPHIVPVYDVGEHADSWFIASALVDGRTLAAAAEDGLPLRTRVDVVRRLADALDYAHGEGVVHRDVKPLNVMMDAADHPHLIDFGLAKLGDDREGGGRAVMGTAHYMSPEQAAGRSHDADARSDQYSLGVTLYELLAGRTPFAGPPSVVLVNVVRHDPPPLLSLDPTLPLDLVLVCQRAMAKDPAGRYASCREFADDLRRWLDGETPRVRVLTRRERVGRWVRRNPKLAGAVGLAAAAVLLAAVLGVAFGVSSTRQARDLAAKNDDLKRSEEETTVQRRIADERAGAAQQALASAYYDRAVGLCEQGEIGQGMNWFVEAIRQAESANDRKLEWAARRSLAAWAFEQNTLARVVRVPFRPRAVAALSDTAAVVAGEDGGRGFFTLFNPQTDERGGPVKVESPVTSVVGLSGGGWFLTGHADGTVRAWRADGTAADSRADLKSPVLALAAHPTRRELLAGCADGKARLLTWADTPAGPTLTPSDTVFAHEAGFEVYAVAFHPHPDTPLVLTGSGRPPDRPAAVPHLGEARQFRTDTGAVHRPPVPHAAAVRGVAYRPDGVQFATATGSLFMGEGRVWATDSHRPVQGGVFPHIAEVNAVAYDPSGRFLVTAGQDRSARAWDAATFRPVGQPMRQGKDVRAVAVAGDRVLVVGDEDAVRVWRVATGPPLASSAAEDGGLILAADRPADGSVWAFTLGAVGNLPLPVLKRRQRDAEVKVTWPEGVAPGPVRSIAHGRGRVAVGGETIRKAGFVALFTSDGSPLAKQPVGRDSPVWAVGLSADAERLAVGCEDGTVGVWSIREGRWKWVQPGGRDGHSDRVYATAFHPDGRAVLTCGRDNTVRVWDADTGEPRHHIPLPDAGLSACFTDDGTHLLVGYAGGCRVFRWAGDGAALQVDMADLPHQAGIMFASVDPVGRTALTGGTDRRVRWWDLSSGKPIGPGWATGGLVRAARFTAPDRVFLADTTHRTGTYREFTLPASADDPLPKLEAWVRRTTGMRLVDGVLEVVPVHEQPPGDDTATGRAVAAWRKAKPAPPRMVAVAADVTQTPPAVAVSPPMPPTPAVPVKPTPPAPPKPAPPKPAGPAAPSVVGTFTRTEKGKGVQIELRDDDSGAFTVTEKGETLLRAKLTAALDGYWVGEATATDTKLPPGGKPIPEKYTFEFKMAADGTVSWFKCDACPAVQDLMEVVNGKYGSK